MNHIQLCEDMMKLLAADPNIHLVLSNYRSDPEIDSFVSDDDLLEDIITSDNLEWVLEDNPNVLSQSTVSTVMPIYESYWS